MEGEDNASFNMAVATLMRLDKILQQMGMFSLMFMGIKNQRMQIQSARTFVLNASPLIAIVKDETVAQQYKDKIFSIRIPTKLIKGKRQEYYDPNLEKDVFGLCMEIQILLKSYFMPLAKKKRMF